MQEIVTAYKDKGSEGVKQVQSTGLHVAGERFVVLKADDRSIYGKKVSFLATASERSWTIRWSGQGKEYWERANRYWKKGLTMEGCTRRGPGGKGVC